MEKYSFLIVTALLGVLLLRLLKPLRWGLKLLLHSGAGLACLTLLNSASTLSGITIPVNAVTALTAGTLGIPGIGLLALLELIS